mmetsp:Transcript_7624/g.22484  ORF Transcript_7624/g.22484 Transcript_7624/m.22484 type:complete len:220 (-) Transcript_7624:449-1108(-)
MWRATLAVGEDNNAAKGRRASHARSWSNTASCRWAQQIRLAKVAAASPRKAPSSLDKKATKSATPPASTKREAPTDQCAHAARQQASSAGNARFLPSAPSECTLATTSPANAPAPGRGCDTSPRLLLESVRGSMSDLLREDISPPNSCTNFRARPATAALLKTQLFSSSFSSDANQGHRSSWSLRKRDRQTASPTLSSIHRFVDEEQRAYISRESPSRN